MKLMIVDDNADMRRMIRSTIADPSDIVSECDDGSGVVESFRSSAPDVVLMDLQMPVMNGITATRELKRVFPGAVVVIVSNYQDQEFRDEAAAAGAAWFFTKDNLIRLKHFIHTALTILLTLTGIPMKQFFGALFCSMLMFSSAFAQTSGTADSTFGVNGVGAVSVPNGGARGGGVRQPDGKLIVVGYAGTSDLDFGITRFTQNGALDSTFGTNGITTVSIQLTDIPYACALQSDGKVIIVGTTSPTGAAGSYDFCAVRLRTDGIVDSTFGTNGRAVLSYALSNQANAVLVQPDGKILLAGSSDYASNQGTQMPLMTRLSSSGQVDATFGNAGWVKNTESADLGYWTWIYAIALNSDGKIYIGGTSTSTGFGTTFVVFRYNANGSVDNAFLWYNTRYSDGLNAGGIAYALAVQQDGKVIAAGTTHNDFYLCRFHTNGSIDGSFGGSLGKAVSLTSSNSDVVRAVRIQDDGKILAVGEANGDLGLARFNTNGTLDNSFGTNGVQVSDLGGFDVAYGVAETPIDGKIIAFGGTGEQYIAAQYHGFTQTAAQPDLPASALTAVLATQTSAVIRWTKGDGTARMVFARVDNAVTFSPVNGRIYTANAAYGAGSNLGSSTFPVYDGSDSVVTVSGLVVGKTYHFSVVEYNGSGDSRTYRQSDPAAGSITVSPLAGSDGSSYVVKLDGVNDHIVKSGVSQGSGPFTVEAWVYFSSSNHSSAGIFNRGSNSVGSLVWKFNMHNNFARIDFYSTNVQTNTAPFNRTVIGTAVVKDDRWHHIAGGYDGSDMFLYVDGNLQGTTSYAGLTLNTSTAPIAVGYDSCCGGRPLNGRVAEFRMWNTARTQSEIRANMHKRIRANDPALITYLHFDDANGTTTFDSVTGTTAALVNFNYDANSGFIKSNPPFGTDGSFAAVSGAGTSAGSAGARVQATVASAVDTVNSVGVYTFGSPNQLSSDVPQVISDVRSQVTWGVQKKGSLTDTTTLMFEYAGTGISSGYAKLLSRSSAAAAWTDVSGQFVHDPYNRTFSRTGSTASAEYSVGTSSDDPLPVEVSAFNVTARRADAIVQWTTAGEVNNAGYEIEKCVGPAAMDGSNIERKWVSAGTVTGHGTTNAPQEYLWTDRQLPPGRYAYRVKQIDRDGNITIIGEAEVIIATLPTVFALFQNYPNPFNPSTTIGFTLQQTGLVSLRIYNTVGQEVASLVNEVREAGIYHEVRFNPHSLASGLYIVRLSSGGQVHTRKMQLVK